MFNKGFLWGAASAAYQVEGGYNQDGKGQSIWDIWSHLEGKAYNGTNGDIAADHYNRFIEDINLMEKQGLKAYRFSIAWTRLLPKGKGEVNKKGIEFYNNLINELIKRDIEPVVTLYHWDLPQRLQEEYDGWESEEIVEDFLQYAKLCFKSYGDRVRYWIVMNEPNIFASLGYQFALHPPGKMDEKSYLKVYHNTALAHGKTVLAFKEMGLEGYIGSSIAFYPAYPASSDLKDMEALENFYQIGPWWFTDIYYKGEYPEKGIAYYRSKGTLPDIKEEDLLMLKKAAKEADFIGINYYQTAMIAHNPIDGIGFHGMNTDGKKGGQKENGILGLYKSVKNENIEYTDWDWAIDPDGLRYGLVELTDRYGIPILISENGLGAFDSLNDKGEVEDDYRIDYLTDHIIACKKAIDQGVNLIGYCTWSFTDLLSWLNGYRKRYGFVYIDFEDSELTRVPKKSYHWYKKVIETNGDSISERKL